ncbi:MAG TPA: HlyD family secretion protein [Rhizomicrobium sp.]|nr:HlyD family secretion protein [Rhizomicrobium sp.]
MAPDKGSDPGQDRAHAPVDALDSWPQSKPGNESSGDSSGKADSTGDKTNKPEAVDALDRWTQQHVKSDQDDKQGGDEEDEKEKKGVFSNPWIKYGGIALLVVLLIGGLIWWLIARQYEDTDDAFIDTHIVHLSPQVAGRVMRIAVNDNQLVHKGQLLVKIDPSDMQARLEQAEAQEAQAETQYQQAVASARGAAAQAVSAQRDLDRYYYLQKINPAAVAQQQVDQAYATAHNQEAQRDAASAQIAGALAQIKVAKANITTATLNLGYTEIVAPVDGHVAQRNVATGNYVSPGQDMMAIVPLELWVTANFKETQLALMRPGQHVSVSVDSCGGNDIDGHVQSIQRGAGQAFGILPPENATGNYVKVVQRVPVKIVLDRVPRDCVLGPGMSVTPTVKVR